MSDPQEPYGQQQYPPPQQPQPSQPGYQYPPQQQPPYPGYATPYKKKPLDLALLVTIAGWVVVGLHALAYLYNLTQDDEFGGGPDFADRFFGTMPTLAQGIFWGGVLLAIGVWLRAHLRDAD